MSSYDRVAYPGHFYPLASPERLATLATLHGLAPAPVDRCRVLEMGCGDGGQLIPLAARFPEGHFVGVDLSAAAVARGGALARSLGLPNVELTVSDIAAFPPDAGEFDYIIAHGVVSWVPEPVRVAMLAILARHLAPHGVAYLSYNAMPGGYLRGLPRDLMRLHTRDIGDPAAKTTEARRIIDLLLACLPAGGPEQSLIRRELAPYDGLDYGLYHDILADVHDPIYFLDFMDVVTEHGLQFLSEASLRFSLTSTLPQTARTFIEAIPDRLLREQYLDFIHVRHFRQTLLCRQARPLELAATPAQLEPLYITTRMRPALPGASLDTPGPLEFVGGDSGRITLTEPLARAILLALADSPPHGLRYGELRARVGERLQAHALEADATPDAALVGQILAAFGAGTLDLRAWAFDAIEAGERPRVGALARHQAQANLPIVTRDLATFRPPGDFVRELVLLLDGTRDRDALLIDLERRLGRRAPGGPAAADNLERALTLLRERRVLEA